MRRLLVLIVLFTANLFAASAPPAVADIAALRNLAPGAYQTVLVLRYSASDSGRYAGGGLVNWIAGSNKAAAACSVYVPNSNPARGRWERVSSSIRSAEQCGIHTYNDTISGVINYRNLVGTGTRMVVVDATGTASTQTIPAGGSLANPTATIGLSAVNGSSTSGMRADGAPALSQAIAPTWSAQHTFSLAPILSTLVGTGNRLMVASATGVPSIPSPTIDGNYTYNGTVTFALPVYANYYSVTNGTGAYVTSNTEPAIYSSNTAGSSPFNQAGHLFISPRISGAVRDVLIVPSASHIAARFFGAGGVTVYDTLTTGRINGTSSVWSGNMLVQPSYSSLWSGLGTPGVGNSEYFFINHDAGVINFGSNASGTGTARGFQISIGGVAQVAISAAGKVFLNAGEEVTGISKFAGPTQPQKSALTSGATIAVNAALADFFTLTLATNATLSNPTNGAQGSHFTVRIRQDATGGRTLNYGTNYRFPDGSVPSLSTAANAIDYLSFIYDEIDDRWDFVGNAFHLQTPS